MKDSLTPVYSPFSLVNVYMTPRSGHDSVDLHQASSSASASQSLLTTSGEGEQCHSEQLLVEKLEEVVSASQRVGVKPSAPFDLIPNEILSLILEQGYFGNQRSFPDTAFRVLAATISRRFRDVTLQTPSLWAAVCLSPANIFDQVDFLPIHLTRSKSHPLNIHLSCFWAPDLTDQVMDILTPHGAKWSKLSITTINDYVFKFLQHLHIPMLNLLAITFHSNQRRVSLPSPIFQNDLPRLTALSLRNVDIDNIGFSLRSIKTLEIRGYGTWPSFSRLNKMIGHSASLRRLILHVNPAVVLTQIRASQSGGQAGPVGQIYLPKLDCVMFYTSEWLTRDIVDFMRLFTYPKLQYLFLRESVASPAQTPNTIITYLMRHKPPTNLTQTIEDAITLDEDGFLIRPTLWVKSADMYHACNSVAPSVATKLTSLELHSAFFPSLERMKEVFANLKNLKHLSLFNLIPTKSLSSIAETSEVSGVTWKDVAGSIDIPTLHSLVVDYHPLPHIHELFGDGEKEFLRLFNIPRLSALSIQNLTVGRWRNVVEVFSEGGVLKYPNLTLLELVGMTEILPLESQPDFVDPAPAFPNLKSLFMRGVSSTSFLCCLLSVHESAGLRFPNLNLLGISGDPFASKPLLHRVIATREALCHPLAKLYLDSSFARNAESLKWMKERVNVVEIFKSPCSDGFGFSST